MMMISSAVEAQDSGTEKLSARFTEVIQKLTGIESQLHQTESHLSQRINTEVSQITNHVNSGNTTVNHQTEVHINNVKNELSSAITNAVNTLKNTVASVEQKVTQSVAANNAAIKQVQKSGGVKRVLHFRTTAETVTIPRVNLNKAVIHVNTEFAQGLSATGYNNHLISVTATFASATQIKIERRNWPDYVAIEVIEYA